ncbi:MAG: hypothetical protein QF477_05740 [SAR202 cluster bacterium]|jgi:hypothetical protein|nr:hypothetical protein [SAR202 cluster bacterium]MDP6663552.1 hypothetical protein [SAR202 cluster bacterium]MDP6800726.1 hypothetical protein [SAR202 cluster bacterium]|tara:strand:+ start:8081 stop:9295 length:1215 start_codon:yes stop_codon:yes gene_type:complete
MTDGAAQAKNMTLLAQHDLDGFGNGGEGIGLQATKDGRRVIYIAHESGPKDYTAVDVTDPKNPKTVIQTTLPHADVRSNSLAVFEDLLLVAYQTSRPGLKPAGFSIYDVADPANPREVSHFDTSGPYSRGAHCLWFVDGKYAHVSTGADDFAPRNQKDDQFHMIVDVGDPSHPMEAGRWWLPGTGADDPENPPVRHTTVDAGFRIHNANVYPQRSDRAYLGYLDGGAIILDIADATHPSMISRVDYHPPFPGFTHTAMPLFERELMIVSDEAVTEDLSDHPKLVWVMDIRDETNPVIISTFPLPPVEEFGGRPGRFGAHNIHENLPVPTSMSSETLIFGTYFNAGVRVHDISDPFRPEEVAYFIPEVPDPDKGVNINDVYVDENGLVYAIDRFKGGLYVLELNV